MNSAALVSNTNAGETQVITVSPSGKLTHFTNVNDVFGNAQIGHSAAVLDRDSIRIWGIDTNRTKGAVEYDRTFNVGDQAEYDSYNTSFYGEIVQITAKRVTIRTIYGKVKHLKIGDFARRNRHFTVAAAEQRNASWCD